VEGLVPFIIHDFGSFKLGIIGLTDPMKAYETIFRLRPQKSDELLPELIQKARQAGAQTLLLLSHLGLKQDQVLAENGAGLDVIIGGHSHDTLTSPLVENGTIIAQAGDFGRFLGRLDFEIDPVSGKVIDHKGTLIPINEDITPDHAATVVVENERKRVHAIMGRVIGSLNARAELADDRECTAGNLLADALLERMQGTRIALVLTGHWETGLEPGPLTQGQLFAAIRSAANPAKVMLSGRQILQFLRAALTPGNAGKSHHSLRGRKIGYPHFAGMTVDVDPLNLDKIQVRIAGELLMEERIYPVATTDMELSDWINYLLIPDEKVAYEVPTIMPEALEAYIKAHTPISPPSTGRLKTLTG
jgi:2',3'-cyclic-nucleotide 2'-phosphodiesterase (5'-nucleotidase family)